SGVLASAIGMDKVMTKQLLKVGGILTPPAAVLEKGDLLPLPDDVNFPFPWVVKPSRQGSTIGISIVRAKDGIGKAMETAFHHDHTILVEAFIEGQEITSGILDDQPLPPVEIVPKEDFYDYRTKTTSGMAEYLVPARLTSDLTREVQQTALKVHRIVGCRGATRVDFRVSRGGEAHVLEINTVPGMTETSLLPRAARAAGIEYDELVERILKSAFREGEKDAAPRT
ncbi:MAG: D-alanine--D-alanine ligase, partial [Nitrospirae bacterium]|nr:D-alanine--D-alanine ligase [Nitrospirota bacterium]